MLPFASRSQKNIQPPGRNWDTFPPYEMRQVFDAEKNLEHRVAARLSDPKFVKCQILVGRSCRFRSLRYRKGEKFMSARSEGNSTTQKVAERRGLVTFFVVLAAAVGIFFGGFYLGRVTFNFPPPPIVFAETTGRCSGGSKVTVSTGNSSGRCVVGKNSDGSASNVSCDDGHGNSAMGECNATGAQCGGTSGSGKCSL
jgi:hypothetical protein